MTIIKLFNIVLCTIIIIFIQKINTIITSPILSSPPNISAHFPINGNKLIKNQTNKIFFNQPNKINLQKTKFVKEPKFGDNYVNKIVNNVPARIIKCEECKMFKTCKTKSEEYIKPEMEGIEGQKQIFSSKEEINNQIEKSVK